MRLCKLNSENIQLEWYKKCHAVLLNEIVPRAKKQNMKPDEFLDPHIAHYLVQLEYQSYITRRELRSMLDDRVKYLNDNISED